MRSQKEQLAKGCDILIATPGRLIDAIERGLVSLAKVKYAVLDEADRILDMGFEPSIRQIMTSSDMPKDEGLQTALFSATFPSSVQVLARDFLKEDYIRIRVGRYVSIVVKPSLSIKRQIAEQCSPVSTMNIANVRAFFIRRVYVESEELRATSCKRWSSWRITRRRKP